MVKINEINNQFPIADVSGNKATSNETSSKTSTFGNMISTFIKAVNEDQIKAKEGVVDVLIGKSENLHEAMAKVEESKLSFELMLEIRNKLLESFKELQRMPV